MYNFDNFKLLVQTAAREIYSIVVVADSLLDEEYRQLQEFTQCYSNVTIKRCDFRSAALTRNLGLLHVKTKWLVFWDCDDQVDLQAYQLVLDTIQLEKFDLIVSQIEMRDFRSGQTSFVSRTNNLNQLGKFPAFTRIIYRHSLIKGLMFVPFPLCEDQCFLAAVLIRLPRIAYSDLVTYIYKIENPHQSTHTLFNHQSNLQASNYISQLSLDAKDFGTHFSLLQMSFWLFLSCIKRIRSLPSNLVPKLFSTAIHLFLNYVSLLGKGAKKFIKNTSASAGAVS